MSEDAEKQREELRAIAERQVAKYGEGIRKAKENFRFFEENHLFPPATIRRMRYDLRVVERQRDWHRALLKELPDKDPHDVAFLLSILREVYGGQS